MPPKKVAQIEDSQYFQDLFYEICSYEDDDERNLAAVFHVLPSKTDYPDYYETIKTPIDLNQIAKNIQNSKYTTLKQLESDLTLMFDNAKRYNIPKSLIYKDANFLKKLTKETCAKLEELKSKNKSFESSASREEKQKLLKEICEMSSEVMNEQENAPNEEGESDSEESESEDEEEEKEEEDEEKSGYKTPKRKYNQKLISMLWNLFDYFKGYKCKNETLIDAFIKLPSKRLYPDYYEDIEKPISMNKIKQKLLKRGYKTVKELFDDFELMFNNAKSYNVEQSVIYKNADRLLEVVRSKIKEIDSVQPNVLTQNILLTSPSQQKHAESLVKKIDFDETQMDEEDWNMEKDDENSNHSIPEAAKENEQSETKKVKKRLKKTGYNLFSREFRKSLRDTKSSLGFTEMSKEVGLRWRALSDKERLSYEERAAAEWAKELELQKQAQKLESYSVPSPKPIQAQVYQTPIQTQAQPEQPKVFETSRQSLHRDAYVRYIANLKKMQQINTSGAINNPITNMSLARGSDWYNGIDVTCAKVKENKVQNPPSGWIENAKSNDVVQNLMSLRYYLLQDAITVERDVLCEQEISESMEVCETNEKNNLKVF